jgi:hypothetical protein
MRMDMHKREGKEPKANVNDEKTTEQKEYE